MRISTIPQALLLALLCCFSVPAQDLVSEEEYDYFAKWLNEDVIYIISEEEREVFESLTTSMEQENFIEQFWFRRDPDHSTSENEFKIEHYRRLAYVNERYASGFPGWMTDRGMIYIIHGPPAQIDSHASGGAYERPYGEGGGVTSTYPFEIWRYRHIEGVGDDVVLEFVDKTMSGEYRLALQPEDKDALLYVTGGGLTIPEMMGVVRKSDRPFFNPARRDAYPWPEETHRNNPFFRWERYNLVQRPPIEKYHDLKQLVQVNVSYSSLPFLIQEDYFLMNPDQALVPVTIQLDNKDLSFERVGEATVARVGIYGAVTTISNRIVTEFEDDLVTGIQGQDTAGLLDSSIYQKVLPLNRKMVYKLDLVVKDMASGKVGVIRRAIKPPEPEGNGLSASSLVITRRLERVDTTPGDEDMFLFGAVKVVPSLHRRFSPESPFGVYFHLYNVALDQTTLSPSLEVAFRLSKEGKILRQVVDKEGQSTELFSGQRVVVMKQLSCRGLEPGRYVFEVEARDRISDQRVTLQKEFEVIDPN